MACWEQPVAGERFPRGLYQVSSCALEQPAVLNAAGASVGTCWKTSTCLLRFPGASCACMSPNLWHPPQRSSLLREMTPASLTLCTGTAALPVICKHGCPMRTRSASYFRRTRPLRLVRGPPAKTATASSLNNLKQRHRGGPSQLKEQADRGVNLSPMLMRSRETFKGPEYQLQGWERGLFGEER